MRVGEKRNDSDPFELIWKFLMTSALELRRIAYANP